MAQAVVSFSALTHLHCYRTARLSRQTRAWVAPPTCRWDTRTGCSARTDCTDPAITTKSINAWECALNAKKVKVMCYKRIKHSYCRKTPKSKRTTRESVVIKYIFSLKMWGSCYKYTQHKKLKTTLHFGPRKPIDTIAFFASSDGYWTVFTTVSSNGGTGLCQGRVCGGSAPCNSETPLFAENFTQAMQDQSARIRELLQA